MEGGEVMYNYLCHHGVKGQKWGVRRYVNKDGTLTKKGRKRLADDGSSNHVSLVKNQKDIRRMSDDELHAYINRMSNEKKAYDLLKTVNKRAQSKVTSTIDKYGQIAAGEAVKTVTKYGLRSVGLK